MSGHSTGFATPEGMPSTSFGSPGRDQNGRITYSDLDWEKIAQFEAVNVITWIKFLHEHKRKEISSLLHGIVGALKSKDPIMSLCARTAYAESGLCMVLMDMASDLRMYQPQSSTVFEGIRVGTNILRAFHQCLMVHLFDERYTSSTLTRELVTVSRITGLCQTLWTTRVSVMQDSDRYRGALRQGYKKHDAEKFTLMAYHSVGGLLDLYKKLNYKLPPLSAYAVHFLIYYWVYKSDTQEMCRIVEPLAVMIEADARNIEACAKVVYTECPTDFPVRFAAKARALLQNDRVNGDETASLLRLCAVLISFFPARYCETDTMSTVDDCGLIPSVMLACRRQMCSTSQSPRAQFSVITGLQIILLLLRIPEDEIEDSPTNHFLNYAGELNFAAIVLSALKLALNTDIGGNELCVAVGLASMELLKDLSRDFREDDWRIDPMLYHIGHNAARIWHDGLKELSAVQTRLEESKHQIIEAWKEIGTVLSLEEGVNVTTLHIPSTPCYRRSYWKLLKRCYYQPCICSVQLPPIDAVQRHKFRACKGCYRVMYCNQDCQNLDWQAGHKDICSTLKHKAWPH